MKKINGRKSGSALMLFLLIISVVTAAVSCRSRADRQNEIIDTVNRLFISTDRMDWQGVKNCFAEEVNFDMSSMTGGKPVKMTPQAIADGWEKGLKGIKAVHHQAGNFIVTQRKGEADVFCYAVAFHYLPNPTGNNVRLFVGSYNFHLIEKNKEWKIDLFRFNLEFIEGNKNLQAYVK